MILDALTRAEHERQLEKQPDLKFVTPVKPEKKNLNKIWLWVGLAILVNALILFFVIRALTGNTENAQEIVSPSIDANVLNEAPIVQQLSNQPSSQISNQQESQPLVQDSMQAQRISNAEPNSQAVGNVAPQEVRPLAMEADTVQIPEVDRPLVYESKLNKPKPKVAAAKPKVESREMDASSKGNVSFSSTELNADAATPVANKPKLLIEGVNNNQGLGQVSNTSASNVPNVRDLPESTRSNLSQYEVNVHV